MATGIGGEIAWWCPSLDDTGNGTTTLTDLVGSNSGTLTNMDAATDWVADTNNGGIRALDFDGTNDYISDGTSLAIGASFTVSFWVKLDSTTGSRWIIGKTDFGQNKRSWHINWAGASNRWEMAVSSDGLSNIGSLTFYGASDTPGTSNWIHVAVCYDSSLSSGNRFKLYKNGTGLTTTPIGIADYALTPYVNDVPIAIAASRSSGSYSNYLDGLLDDVRLFNSVISASDITDLASMRGFQPTSRARRLINDGLFNRGLFNTGLMR